MRFQYNDGGRRAAGYKGGAGDCVCRAIAIVTEKPYEEIYNLIDTLSYLERLNTKRSRGRRSSARSGVKKSTIRRVMAHLGLCWVPTMGIGTGCRVHLREGELPPHGRFVVNLSGHLSAIVDGVIHDTYDPSRDGTRCVYGYWYLPC